jgi:hypothetical protein
MFLVGPYTESLFLGLTLLAFYLARKDRWLWAGLAGALASLTRGPGVLTAFALAWIAYTKWRGDRLSLSPRLIRMALGTAAPGLAGLGFILWRQWMGFPPVADVLAEHFGVTMVNPLVGVFTALRTMLQLPTLPVVLDGLTVLVWLGLFVLVILRWRRIPMEWILYMGLNLLVTTSKVTTIISPMQSIGRYVLVLFPAFVMIGEWLAHTTPRKRFAYIAGSGSVLLVYCALYAVGFFIG